MTCRRSQVRVLYRAPRVCNILHVTDSFLLYRPEPARPMSKTKPVGAHSICARGGLSYRKRARADMESAPTFFVAGRAPRAEAAKGRVFAYCACKRIYFRLRLVKNHLMWYTIFLQVHRQTRCKPATQSYRGPSGQPVANKKLLFYCRRQLRVLFGAGVDEGENTPIHRRHKAGHL